MLVSADRHCVRAGETDRPKQQDDATRLFLEKYSAATTRLEAGLSRLHGKGRVREFRGSEPGDWTSIEFFIDDGKLRVDRDYGALNEGAVAGNLRPPEAILLTSETAAKVIDPYTEFAFAKYLSEKPDEGLEIEVRRTVWRFLRAAYCLDDSTLNERITDGRWTVESVERDPASNGWVHVRLQFIEPDKNPIFSSHGSVDVWLDEAQDFVIRRTKLVSLEPYMFEAVQELGPYLPLGNGAWLPKACSIRVYDLKTAPAEGEARACSERIEFELLDGVETSAIPESYFSLESLGVYPARRGRKFWVLVVSAAALVAVLAITIRLARRSAKRRHLSL
jgi:hypothetical protein